MRRPPSPPSSPRERARRLLSGPDVPEAADVVSYGGGWQSAAIAALVIRGELPRPERLVMVDTGREAAAVWAYLDAVVNPALRAVGLAVEIAPHSLATVDLVGGADGRTLLTPAWTTRGRGGDRPALMAHYCSVEWKRRVFRRYLRSLGYGPGRPVRAWLGFSTDELERAAPSDAAWCAHRFPLLFDRPTRRADCPGIVRSLGWPDPPKSACWMCALRSDAEWRALREAGDGDWERAVAFDRAQRDGSLGAPPDAEKFLHPSGVPLADADLDGRREPDLFGCASGHCFL